MTEFAYDYVEIRRDYLAWTPTARDPLGDGVRIAPQHGIEEHQNMMNTTNGLDWHTKSMPHRPTNELPQPPMQKETMAEKSVDLTPSTNELPSSRG